MPPEITGGGSIFQALEAALWAFHRSETFREGLARRQSGTRLGCGGRGLWPDRGAYHGVSAIPGIWRNSLMKQEVVIDSADALLTHALVTLGS